MRKYILLLLVLYSYTAFSQNCNFKLSGQIIDLHDNTPLVGALVILAGTEEAFTTDIDGNFTIPNLCDRKYAIQVSHEECDTKGFTFTVTGNISKTFKLEHHLSELNEVTITGKAYKNKTKTVLESTLKTEDLEKFSNGSLGDALNSVAGVSSLNTGNTVIKPLINGLHSSRVVIINNGVRLEDQEWGAEHAPNIDINSAGHITLIKGANALQYGGNAIGGVIITEAPKIPVLDTLYGKTLGTFATNGRGGTISSQLTKSFKSGWFASVQGGLKRFGDFEAPDYVLSNTGMFERAVSARLGLNRFNFGIEANYTFYKNELGILRASHLGGAQDQVRAITSTEPLIINDFTYDINAPKQDVTHHTAKLKAFKTIKGLGRLDLQYDFQLNKRLEFDIRRGDDKDKASLDLDLKTHAASLNLDSKFSEKLNFKGGIVWKYQNNVASANTGVRRLIPDYDKYEFGVYGIANYKATDKLLLEAGLRFDYTYLDVYKYYRKSFWESRNYNVLFADIVLLEINNQIATNPKLTFNNPSATAGLTYNINDNNVLFANYSMASRAPNPSELFSEGLHHSASRIEYGDLGFTSETAHKIAVTWQYKTPKFNVSVNPYANFINDYILIEPIGVSQTTRGNFQVWEYKQTNARLLGFDIEANYNFTKQLSSNHKLALVKGYDRKQNRALINMPATNMQNEIVYNNFNLKNLTLALESNYVFRQNEYPNNNFEVYIPQTNTYETVDISTPPNAYHLLNFNSSIDFKLQQNTKLTVGLGVTNIFNTNYRNYLNRFRFYADDLGRNFLLNFKINY